MDAWERERGGREGKRGGRDLGGVVGVVVRPREGAKSRPRVQHGQQRLLLLRAARPRRLPRNAKER